MDTKPTIDEALMIMERNVYHIYRDDPEISAAWPVIVNEIQRLTLLEMDGKQHAKYL
jgi:hypothetical protein